MTRSPTSSRKTGAIAALAAYAMLALPTQAQTPASAIQDAVAANPYFDSAAPADVAQFCPDFSALGESDKRAFWGSLLSAIGEAEGGAEPSQTHWLLYDGAVHRPAFRRGLFQISIEAARSPRYDCAVRNATDLAAPEANAACAAKILETSIRETGAIAGAGRYWPSLAHAERRARISVVTSSRSPCSAAEPNS